MAALRGGTMGGTLPLPLLLVLPWAGGFSFPAPRARWSMPTDPLSSAGLGRSIAYVVDPQLCQALLPQFLELEQVLGGCVPWSGPR